MISITMAAEQAAENHGDEWRLTRNLRKWTYALFQPKPTHKIH